MPRCLQPAQAQERFLPCVQEAFNSCLLLLWQIAVPPSTTLLMKPGEGYTQCSCAEPCFTADPAPCFHCRDNMHCSILLCCLDGKVNPVAQKKHCPEKRLHFASWRYQTLLSEKIQAQGYCGIFLGDTTKPGGICNMWAQALQQAGPGTNSCRPIVLKHVNFSSTYSNVP